MSDGINKSPELIVNEVPDDEEAPVREAPADTLRILEALIFASDEPLTASRLKTILPNSPGGREIGAMVEKINRQLQKERHPFEIVEIGGGYQFKTVAFYHPWVRQIFQEKAAKRLSIQALECLSIIAYRQPLSKAEIEGIRGVISDGAMKTLLEKRLVTITGRSEKPGRPLLYGTTPEFLHYFGLNKLADLPNIEEFEAMVREKIEHLPIDELEAAKAEQKKDEGGMMKDEEGSERTEDGGERTEDGGWKIEPVPPIVETIDDAAASEAAVESIVIVPDDQDQAVVAAAEDSLDPGPAPEES